MGYQSKTYSLSDEVVEAIEAAKAQGVTPNQLLKSALLERPAGMVAEHTLNSGGAVAEHTHGATLSVKEPTHFTTKLVAGESKDVTPESWKSDPPPQPVKGTITVEEKGGKTSATVNVQSDWRAGRKPLMKPKDRK